MNHLQMGSSRFGMGSWQNYKYNGKELQTNGMYDYGARFYMSDVGIFGQHDPLSEKTMQPYAYVYNNPIKYIDPTGMEAKKVDDIIIKGRDKKEWRIKAAGQDKVFNVPFDLKNNNFIDLGIGNIDPSRLAVGYTIQGEIGAGLGIVGAGGIELSVVRFTDDKYSGYNYVYAGAREQFSAGVQATIYGSIEGSISIAYNTAKYDIDPTTYAGITCSAGISADIKKVVGGGISVSIFSGSGKDLGWKGFSIGVNSGVGAGVNIGSANVALSKNWLLNDVKPTAQRSFLDRATNLMSPISSAITTGTLDRIKQFKNRK